MSSRLGTGVGVLIEAVDDLEEEEEDDAGTGRLSGTGATTGMAGRNREGYSQPLTNEANGTGGDRGEVA